jgi:hypothetical protein
VRAVIRLYLSGTDIPDCNARTSQRCPRRRIREKYPAYPRPERVGLWTGAYHDHCRAKPYSAWRITSHDLVELFAISARCGPIESSVEVRQVDVARPVSCG